MGAYYENIRACSRFLSDTAEEDMLHIGRPFYVPNVRRQLLVLLPDTAEYVNSARYSSANIAE